MTTNLTDLLSLIETTLDGNVTINNWCQERFQRKPTIFVGLSPLNPPEFEGQCPMIVIGSGARSREAHQAHRIHTIRVGLAIENKKTTTSASGQVTRYNGLTDIDGFADVVEKIITAALNSAGYAAIQEAEAEDETLPPIFKATLSYQVRCPSRLR